MNLGSRLGILENGSSVVETQDTVLPLSPGAFQTSPVPNMHYLCKHIYSLIGTTDMFCSYIK